MHALPRTLLSLLPLSLVPAVAACDGSSKGGAAAATAGDDADDARAIRDLITALTPLPASATAGQENDWYRRRKETLERLRAREREFGLLALEAYRERAGAPREVRSGLLDVAAHAAPAETAPVLEELVTTYGDDLGVRKAAAELLAVAAPERAVAALEPIVAQTDRDATYPPTEALLAAWLGAMHALQRDPAPVLADVATDMRQEESARHAAIKALGLEPRSARGSQALEIVLVESIGNNMARRFAAQSLRATLPKEELCAILERVFDNEADLGFQQFLASMLEENCY